MTHADHIMIGLMVGAAGALWRIGKDGLAQMKTLKDSKREINRAIVDTESEKSEVEEEISHMRDSLDTSISDLEKLKARYDELTISRQRQ